jgi:RNA polymerase sigma factor (sigma-70 family)
MADQQLQTILLHMRKLIPPPRSGVTDAQLLERFLGQRDEAAFELLVWRHGPMVLGVGGRILHDTHDAEDVFQATFLTLARKAGSIGKRESVGSWLYKVAYRLALRARARSARRAGREKPLADLPPVEAGYEPADELAWRELGPVLDDEVRRLPEKYRAAFVLCYLEGKTNEETAKQLGCPKGTVLSRLARARERLRGRLARRGLVLASAALLTLLGRGGAALASPAAPALVSTTVQLAGLASLGKSLAGHAPAAVLELLDGTWAVVAAKLKLVTAVLTALLLITLGAAVFARGTSTPNPTSGDTSGSASGDNGAPAVVPYKGCGNH